MFLSRNCELNNNKTRCIKKNKKLKIKFKKSIKNKKVRFKLKIKKRHRKNIKPVSKVMFRLRSKDLDTMKSQKMLIYQKNL